MALHPFAGDQGGTTKVLTQKARRPTKTPLELRNNELDLLGGILYGQLIELKFIGLFICNKYAVAGLLQTHRASLERYAVRCWKGPGRKNLVLHFCRVIETLTLFSNASQKRVKTVSTQVTPVTNTE